MSLKSSLPAVSAESEESDGNKITIFYCFRTEMQNQMALRILRTEHRFWYLIARDIEQALNINGPPRQKGKATEQTFLSGKVVGHLESHQTNVRMADLREAETAVKFLECGSTMESGDIVVLCRIPSSHYYRNQSALWLNWRAHCATNKVPANVTFEEGAQLARRYNIPAQYAHLARGVQHNFDVGSQSARFEELSVIEQLEKQEEQKERIKIELTPEMNEEDRIALVSSVGSRLFESGAGGAGGGGANASASNMSFSTGATGARKTHSSYNRDFDEDGRRKRQRTHPPSHYVCNRCHVPGHWMHECPTRGDTSYDRARVVKPTGIPRALLRKLDTVDETNANVAIMKIGNVAYKQIDRSNQFDTLYGMNAKDKDEH